jgi:BirA family biotin operon repressor/biotin-[acetyl-CoA-carboxylase] ligase
MTWQVEYHEALDSTMRVAAERPAWTAVVAREQTAGIGRQGHSWHSERDAGLYVSLVLPSPPGGTAVCITLALGLAAAEAIAQATGIVCDIRWPNDLMLGHRKTAGIMAQMAEEKIVAGIGINVNHTLFPPDLVEEATSLRLHAGREFSRDKVLECLLDAVESYAVLPVNEVLDLFARASSYCSGRRVTVEGVTGVTAGLDPSGFLRVRGDDGNVRVVLAGGVRAISA